MLQDVTKCRRSRNLNLNIVFIILDKGELWVKIMGMNNAASSSLYSNIVPTFSPLSGLRNLQVSANGTPDISQLSQREIGAVFDAQNGLYQALEKMAPNQLSQIENTANQSQETPPDVLLTPLVNKLMNSQLYQWVKSQTSWQSGYTSRQLYQLSVNPTIAPLVRLCLKMRGDALTADLQTWNTNFQYVMDSSNNDQDLQDVQKDLDKSTQELQQSSVDFASGGDG